MNIVNLDLIDNKNKTKKHKNINGLAPQWPFRMLATGPSGSGKTNMVLCLVYCHLHYDMLYIYTKTPEQNKYQDLINMFENMVEKTNKKFKKETISIDDLLYISDSLEDVFDPTELDNKKQNLVIFDDFITSKDQKIIENYFVHGRHSNCSVIYLSQSYFETPKMIRQNCNYFAFFSLPSKNNLTQIVRDHDIDLDKKEFMKMFNECIGDPKEKNFFLLSKDEQCPGLKYRKNFDSIYTPLSLIEPDKN
jgi:hypothetical protein